MRVCMVACVEGWLLIVLLLYVDVPIGTCLFIVICDGFALVIGLWLCCMWLVWFWFVVYLFCLRV